MTRRVSVAVALAGVPVALLGLLVYAAILGSLARDGERARTLPRCSPSRASGCRRG